MLFQKPSTSCYLKALYFMNKVKVVELILERHILFEIN